MQDSELLQPEQGLVFTISEKRQGAATAAPAKRARVELDGRAALKEEEAKGEPCEDKRARQSVSEIMRAFQTFSEVFRGWGKSLKNSFRAPFFRFSYQQIWLSTCWLARALFAFPHASSPHVQPRAARYEHMQTFA